MSPAQASVAKRRRGEGGIFQRCDAARGCPPRKPMKQDDGTTKLVRPKHKCRGMWIARLDLGPGPDGRPRRPQRASATQAGAFDALEELRRQYIVHGDVPVKNVTVEAWLTRWLKEFVRPRNDPGTYDSYRGHVRNNLIPHLGRYKLSQLQPSHIRQMFAAMKTRGVAGSRGGAHRTLRKALNDAMREGLVMRNVAKLVTPPSSRSTKRTGLTTVEGRRVLSYVQREIDGSPADPFAARWAMALLTGARPGECIGLTRDRYDPDTGVMDISWKLERITFDHGCGDGPVGGKEWPCGKIHGGRCPDRHLRVPEDEDYEYEQLDGGLCLTRPKTLAGKRMSLALPTLLLAINSHLERDRGRPNPHNLVWHEPDGSPIEPADEGPRWRAVLSGAGIRKVDLYDARHTTVTLLMEANVDPMVIKAIAGHSSLTSQEAYKHVRMEHIEKALTAVAAALES